MDINHIDIVVPFVHSINRDEELRYALRSAEMYIPGIRNVFIVGSIPCWLHQNLTVIPYTRASSVMYKEANIAAKIKRAVDDERVSDSFIVLHDDNYLQQVFTGDKYYHQGNVWKGTGIYGQTEANTREYLSSLGYVQWNYDVHAPHLFTKQGFNNSVAKLDWGKPFGYAIKTIYGCHNLVDILYESDCKVSIPQSDTQVREAIAGRPFFSISDEGFRQSRRVLKELYPKPSKYEAC
jgi:hypothetical protein